jgi:hypothetical protein
MSTNVPSYLFLCTDPSGKSSWSTVQSIVTGLRDKGHAARHLGYGNAALNDKTITSTLKDLDVNSGDGNTTVIVTAHKQGDADAQDGLTS